MGENRSYLAPFLRPGLTVIQAIALALLSCATTFAGPVNDEALLAAKPPRLLSEYALFEDAENRIPAEGVLPYDLITPLFTDYALKYRFVYVPEGQTAQYRDSEVFEFPVGSVLIKTFAYPEDFRSPEENIHPVETRLLIRQGDGWKSYAYVWNDKLGDAELKLAGKRIDIDLTGSDGNPLLIHYAVPNANQCKGCHALGHDISPIGPKARNLNHDFAYPSGTRNQIAAWTEAGILDGAPSPDEAPRAADWSDETETLDRRARSYLDVNCGHCHRLEGPASNSGLFLLSSIEDETTWGVRKRPVAAGRGSGDLHYDIDPGHPDRSILIYRMESLDPGVMMPELGRSMVHREAVDMLKDWIAQLD
jgi:uncharacterized repeat protein (TIGR03806 family)